MQSETHPMCIPVPERPNNSHTTSVTSESGELLHFVEKILLNISLNLSPRSQLPPQMCLINANNTFTFFAEIEKYTFKAEPHRFFFFFPVQTEGL